MASDILQEETRRLLALTGLTPQHISRVMKGLDITDELSEELGEISSRTATELSLISIPLLSVVAVSMDPDGPDALSLFRELISEAMRAAYQAGRKKERVRDLILD